MSKIYRPELKASKRQPAMLEDSDEEQVFENEESEQGSVMDASEGEENSFEDDQFGDDEDDISPSPSPLSKKNIRKVPEPVKTKKSKNRPDMNDSEVPYSVDAKKMRARYLWVKSQLPISCRPAKVEVQSSIFSLDDVSPNLKRCIFDYSGHEAYTPTEPLKIIYTEESVEFNPKTVKGWEHSEALVKKSKNSKEAEWVPLCDVIPSEYRNNKKAAQEEPIATKKMTSTKVKAPVAKSKKRKQATDEEDIPVATPCKKKKTSMTTPKSKKAATQKPVAKQTQKRQVHEEQEEEESENEEQEIRLSSQKVLALHNYNTSVIQVPPAEHHTTLSIVLKYELGRLLFSMDLDETLFMLKRANRILGLRSEPAIPEPSQKDLGETINQTLVTKSFSISQKSSPLPEESNPFMDSSAIIEEKDNVRIASAESTNSTTSTNSVDKPSPEILRRESAGSKGKSVSTTDSEMADISDNVVDLDDAVFETGESTDDLSTSDDSPNKQEIQQPEDDDNDFITTSSKD